VSSYTPDARGLHELATSPGMQAATTAAAQRGAAAAAAADPRGKYVVSPTRVTAGRRDETRAGALITDDGPDSMGRESERHTLNRDAVRAIESENDR
jgi:hypothetical protein